MQEWNNINVLDLIEMYKNKPVPWFPKDLNYIVMDLRNSMSSYALRVEYIIVLMLFLHVTSRGHVSPGRKDPIRNPWVTAGDMC